MFFNGDDNMKYFDYGKDFDIFVNYDDYNCKLIEDVCDVYFINNCGEEVCFSQFVIIGKFSGLSKLECINCVFFVMVSCQVLGIFFGQVIFELM